VLAAGTADARDEVDPLRRSAVVQAVEQASPAVVNISTEQVIERRASPFPSPEDPAFEDFFGRFFDSRPRRFTSTSLGSGVLVAEDGTILTNEHVVLRASKIHVTLVDGREIDAKLLGADADSDIAVLQLKGGGAFPHITLGTSRDILIGETVIAIGNPFGLSHTVTTGVVSALGRAVRGEEHTYTDFIQTDASINPGNSGGPLLNIKGELIGINTAIYGKAQGIGFAIPVDRAKRAWVGAVVQDLSPELRRHFGTSKGVVLTDVEPHSPADKAGLTRGLVVTRVDGREVRSKDEFDDLVENHGAGDTIVFTVRDEENEREVRVTGAAFPDADADDLGWRLIGVAVEERDEVLVVAKVHAGSPAARIGIQRGDQLLGLGGVPVRTRSDFRKRMIELRTARGVLLSVGRGPYQYNVNVPLARER
jgi:serine protease Do